MPDKSEIPIAEGVRIKCELCSGTGKGQQINFRENDAGSHEINCYLCTGKGWVYAPQDEMAERISSLAHQLSQEKERNARLTEALRVKEEECERLRDRERDVCAAVTRQCDVKKINEIMQDTLKARDDRALLAARRTQEREEAV